MSRFIVGGRLTNNHPWASSHTKHGFTESTWLPVLSIRINIDSMTFDQICSYCTQAASAHTLATRLAQPWTQRSLGECAATVHHLLRLQRLGHFHQVLLRRVRRVPAVNFQIPKREKLPKLPLVLGKLITMATFFRFHSFATETSLSAWLAKTC